MNEPALTVVIPAYNASEFIERAIESVFATGYQNISVLVVDDGSTDGTATVVQNVARQHSRCRLISHSDNTNRGVSASRNLAINETDAEWIAFLDADDWFLPNRFGAFKDLLSENLHFDAVYGIAKVEVDESGITPFGSPDRGALFGIQLPLKGSALLSALMTGNCWPISAITVRRDLLCRVGLFDPKKKIAEDFEVWIKIALLGVVVPGDLESPAAVYWRHGNNTYSYQHAHRLPVLSAMLDASSALADSPESGKLVQVYRNGVANYVITSVIDVWRDRSYRIAVQMLLEAIRHGFVITLFRLAIQRSLRVVRLR